jgi:serine/threonine-protein kinase
VTWPLLLPYELRADRATGPIRTGSTAARHAESPARGHDYGIVEAEGAADWRSSSSKGRADRLSATALPVSEALRLARQIADGLDAIHAQGVVHRDLKPANIKISPQGLIKVIDFGIGKELSRSAADVVATPAPSGQTTSGAILGTPSYMSPEQASGGAVDKRTDIWAFGCVLFEMLTGARAFPGEDAREALAGVLGGAPDWRRLPLGAPWTIRRLLRRCLEKDPAERLRDIGDARLDIDEAIETTGGSPGDPRTRSGWLSTRMAGVAGVVGGVLAGIVGAALLSPRSAPVPPPAVQRFSLLLPASTERWGFALSPDGATLVYETQGQLFLQSLDDLQPRLLPGTENAVDPFFSPDGAWIGFVSAPLGQGLIARRGQLRKVSVQGGIPVTLAAAVALGGSWGVDGRIVFARQTERGVGLFSVTASGGTPVQLTAPRRGCASWPAPSLPDGKTIVFSETDTPTFDSARVAAWAPGWGEPRPIIDVDTARDTSVSTSVPARRQRDGGGLRRTGTLSGSPVRVIAGVQTEPINGASSLSVAATGLMVYAQANDASRQSGLSSG